MEWQAYLQKHYPSRELPLSVKEVSELLKNVMQAGVVKKDKVIGFSPLSFYAVLQREGFRCVAKTITPAAVPPVPKLQPEVASVPKTEIPANAFEDDFDEAEFTKLVENNSLRPQYSYTDNAELFEEYHRDPSRSSRVYADIITANQRLVRHVAKRYLGVAKQTGLTWDDLTGYGNEGLIKAIDKFDPSMGNAFSTYATYWIRQSIARKIADEAWLVRMPVHMEERLNRLRQIEDQQLRLHDTLDIPAICKELEIDVDQYKQLHQWQYQYRGAISLNQLIATDTGGDGQIGDFVATDSSELMVTPEDPETVAINADVAYRIDQLIDQTLTERQAEVIRLRFGLDENDPMTLEEVGKRFGVTRERIRQIEAKSIKILKRRMNKQGRDDYEFKEC